MPTSMIAAISSEVATGRRMKRRDGFTPGLASCQFFGSLAALPATAAPAFGLGVFGRGVFGLGRVTARVVAPLGLAASSRDAHLGAVAQPIGAIDNDDLPL